MSIANWDWFVSGKVRTEAGNKISVQFVVNISGAAANIRQAFQIWLADVVNGGLTGTAPSTVEFSPVSTEILIKTWETNKYWTLLTKQGSCWMTFGYNGSKTWQIKTGCVDGLTYSTSMTFT